MTTLKILKASHGDGFILTVKKEDQEFNMIIDGGPGDLHSIRELKLQLRQLPQIDMIVLTHYDRDHIGTLIKNFEEIKKYITPDTILWVNLPQLIQMPSDDPNLSYREALDLGKYLKKLEKEKGITLRFHEKIVAGYEFQDQNNLISIKVISPTESEIEENLRHLEKKEAPDESYKATLLAHSQITDAETPKPLEELIDRDYTKKQVVNDSSMAFWVKTADGVGILFGGDASAKVMTDGLKLFGHDTGNPLEVDLYKVSHHGSKYNVSDALLGAVKTSAYLFSTNGGANGSHHPDRETIARILLHPARNREQTITLFFNYSREEIEKKNPKFLTDEDISNSTYNFNIKDKVSDISFPIDSTENPIDSTEKR